MFQIKFRPMKFLKDGRAIVSGPLALVGQPGLQCLSPRAFKGKFQGSYLILMVEFLVL